MLFFIILLVPIGLLLAIVGVRFWKMTVIAVMIWALFEGAVRKWLFPAWQAPILQMKDIALFAAYIGYIISPKTYVPEADRVRIIQTLFIVMGVYCFLEILNPAMPSRLLAFYGFKSYMIYIPLVFLIPDIIKTREQIQKLVFWSFILAVPLGLLGLYQFSQPPTHWINQYVSHEEGAVAIASMFGDKEGGEFIYGRARTASTFSYIGGFMTWLLYVVPLAGAMLLGANQDKRLRLYAVVALVISIGATFTTGARTPIVIFAVAIPVTIFIAGSRGLLPLATALRLTATGALASVVGFFMFSGAANALLFRAQNSDSAVERVFSPFTELWGAIELAPLFGLGIGSNSNAAASLVDSSFYWLPFLVEGEPARVVQDLGIAGFAIVYSQKAIMAYLVVKWAFWSRSKLYIAMHLAILSFIVPHVVLITINNPTGGLFFWGLSGLALSMFRMERTERREAEARLQWEHAQMQRQQQQQQNPPPRGADPALA